MHMPTFDGGGSGVSTTGTGGIVVRYTATGAEGTSFFVPIGQTLASADYVVMQSNQGVTNVNTTVRTATTSLCRQGSNGPTPGARCLPFNPFTETPVEGVHWVKGPLFGQPVNPTSGEPFGGAGDFQLPRTYRFSLGARF